MRRFVIGDIHGCGKALRTLLEEIAPTQDDELVFLGDYIDRGPDSRNVVDQLLELKTRTRLVALRGNHEIMLLGVTLGGLNPSVWLSSGGRATLTSYGGSLEKIPDAHLEFFQSLHNFYETDEAIFVHAGYDPQTPMPLQQDAACFWEHLPSPPLPPPAPHLSGKRVFVGHTPQAHGSVLNLGHLVCVDTYCFGGGYLTAMDVVSDELIQVDRHGHQRRHQEFPLTSLLRRLRDRLSERLSGNRDHRPDSTSARNATQVVPPENS